jgi:hypothetical protein
MLRIDGVLRLAFRFSLLLLLFALAMAFVALGVFSQWWYALIGAGVLAVFIALGGLLVPSARGRVRQRDVKAAAALSQAFGAWCALLFLVMALVTWCYGNRYLHGNSAYEALGLIIFLGLLGVGIQGALFTLVRFAYVHNQGVLAERGGSAPA